MKKIYMDYAATTPVDNDVLKEMVPFFDKKFGNPSSIHSYGRDAFNAVENSRQQVADLINANMDIVNFTLSYANRTVQQDTYDFRNKKESKESINIINQIA